MQTNISLLSFKPTLEKHFGTILAYKEDQNDYAAIIVINLKVLH